MGDKSGFILLLNGTSSAGKSSISKKLLKLLPNSVHLELDAVSTLYFNMFPSDFDFVRDFTEERLARRRLMREMLLYIAQMMARNSFNVIIDTCLDGPDHRENTQCYLEGIRNFENYFVAVKCDIDVAVAREKKRGDREVGTVMFQANDIHDGKEYVFEVDTTTKNSELCAKEIYEFLYNKSEKLQYGNNYKEVL